MKKHWREWFAQANAVCWQGIPISEQEQGRLKERESPASTEAMYQAFKARFLEEMGGDFQGGN